ncbi:hypothetical protein MHK_005330, partial [Candidatus Magnetomorum sp. HK-1]
MDYAIIIKSYQIALTHLEKRKYHLALKEFNKIIENHSNFSNFSESYYNRGICYYYLKKYNEAINDFSTALVNNPNDQEYL